MEQKLKDVCEHIKTVLAGLNLDDHIMKSWPDYKINKKPKSFEKYDQAIDFFSSYLSDQESTEQIILKNFYDIKQHLLWGQTYTEQDLSASFLNNYFWTELIGPKGPCVSEDIRVGLLFLGSHTVYPNHLHKAPEYYIPLSAGTLWFNEDEGWKERNSFELVYHRSGIQHAMITKDEPLCAIYLWYRPDIYTSAHF